MFYDQLVQERAAWERERGRLLGVIAVQQKELAAQGGVARERAVEVARTFGDTIGVFEQRLIAVEQGVTQELKLLRSRMREVAGGGETAEKLKALEKKIDWLCMSVAPNN